MASPAAAAPPSASKRGIVALAAAVALLPLALPNNYTYEIAILVGLNAIVCVGLNLLIGYAGQISLGHAGFFGLGAYGSAILAARYGWPTPLSLVAAVSAVALLAWAIGRPSGRYNRSAPQNRSSESPGCGSRPQSSTARRLK